MSPGFAFLKALAAAEAISSSQNEMLVATLQATAIQLVWFPLRINVDTSTWF